MKVVYLFLQFSSEENLIFCITCLTFEDKIKSSKTTTIVSWRVVQIFAKVQSLNMLRLHKNTCESEDMQDMQELREMYKKR